MRIIAGCVCLAAIAAPAQAPRKGTPKPAETPALRAHIGIDWVSSSSDPIETSTVVVTLDNVGRKDVVLRWRGVEDKERQFRFIVKDSVGRLVPLTRYGRAVYGNAKSGAKGPLRVARVGAGRNRQFRFALDRLYDISTGGMYSAQLELRPATDVHVARPVLSNVVTFGTNGVWW